MLPFLLALSQVDSGPIVREVLVAGPYPQRRSVLRVDPVDFEWVSQARLNVSGWKAIQPNANGEYQGRELAGGYALAKVDSPTDQTVLLEAAGHSMVMVNGVPRGGDVYSYGYVSLPIKLRKGSNELLFGTGRGSLTIRFKPSPGAPRADLRDLTTFDLHPRNPADGMRYVGVVVQNPLGSDATNVRFEGPGVRSALLPSIPAMSVRKVPIELSLKPSEREVVVPVKLMSGTQELQSFELRIQAKKPNESFRRTFLSRMDGSVQYFAVNPAKDAARRTATILSLHGASVEAIGQAQAYGQKEWADVVAATNRRPFGFDWEDLGRKDALEVLKIAQVPGRPVVLTGHSMGGHGTWNVSANTPGVFSAIAPCAGWESFLSYAGGMDYPDNDAVGRIIERGALPSRTLSLRENYRETPIYIVHGAADDTVPVEEARRMFRELQGIPPELKLHEEPGQSHWYDLDPAPGADSVDWPPMMRWLQQKAVPIASRKSWSAVTANPAITSLARFGTEVIQQVRPGQLSRVEGSTAGGRLVIKTQNVARLRVTLQSSQIQIDGQTVPPATDYRLENGRWVATGPVPITEKNPRRSSGFKEVLDHRVVFVYATGGDARHNDWARNAARYYAEQFWYRGNAAVDVVPDTEWARSKDARRRNALVFGNESTVRGWDQLVGDCPIRTSDGKVLLAMAGGPAWKASGSLAVFVRPLPKSGDNLVGVIAPTDAVSERLANRLPLFTPGASFPDWLIFSPTMLKEGLSGIRGAGYFGNQWQLSPEDSALRS